MYQSYRIAKVLLSNLYKYQLDNSSPIMVAVASKHSLYRSLSWTAAGLLGHGWAVGGPGCSAPDCSAV